MGVAGWEAENSAHHLAIRTSEAPKMHGTLDIRRNSNLGSSIEQYQVRYEDLRGDSFAGSMDKKELHNLLYEKLAMNMSDVELDRAYDHVVRDGHVRLPEIEMREEELAGAGLKFLAPEG